MLVSHPPSRYLPHLILAHNARTARSHSGANRLRFSVDVAVCWVYVCSLVAAVLAGADDNDDGSLADIVAAEDAATATMLQAFPIGAPVCLLLGWYFPVMQRLRKKGGGEASANGQHGGGAAAAGGDLPTP